MPRWRIEWSEEADRDVSKLETPVAKRIFSKLEKAAEEPARYFSRLRGCDDFKLRVGDYRVKVLLLREKETVFVEKVGHRRNIYKRR